MMRGVADLDAMRAAYARIATPTPFEQQAVLVIEDLSAKLKVAADAWDMLHFSCDNPDHSVAYREGAKAFGYT